jgi:hypothetical protein
VGTRGLTARRPKIEGSVENLSETCALFGLSCLHDFVLSCKAPRTEGSKDEFVLYS